MPKLLLALRLVPTVFLVTPAHAATGMIYLRTSRDGRAWEYDKDGTDDRRTTSPGAWLDMIYPAPDGTVYATSGPDGTLYRYRTGDTAFTKVAEAPSPGDGARKMRLLDEHTMLGITGSGGMWWLDLRAGKPGPSSAETSPRSDSTPAARK